MTTVYEDPASLDYLTTYAYDVMNHLTGVSQGSQSRSYNYDGMGRMTSSTPAEAAGAEVGPTQLQRH
jgi:YD repeat-containing protein